MIFVSFKPKFLVYYSRNKCILSQLSKSVISAHVDLLYKYLALHESAATNPEKRMRFIILGKTVTDVRKSNIAHIDISACMLMKKICFESCLKAAVIFLCIPMLPKQYWPYDLELSIGMLWVFLGCSCKNVFIFQI